jgi:hypothetical protein
MQQIPNLAREQPSRSGGYAAHGNPAIRGPAGRADTGR